MSMNLTDPKLGYVVGTGTTGSGLGTWLDLIPNEIGKLATVVGICLSVVLIVMHLRKMQQDSREGKLREELLREQIKQVREDD